MKHIPRTNDYATNPKLSFQGSDTTNGTNHRQCEQPEIIKAKLGLMVAERNPFPVGRALASRDPFSRDERKIEKWREEG